MIQPFITVLDWFGLCVFAVTGALVASRKEMDIVGFALLGSVTGIGGGTIRDVLLGAAASRKTSPAGPIAKAKAMHSSTVVPIKIFSSTRVNETSS